MGPGLRKATRPRVFVTRSLLLAKLDEAVTRDWLDEADIVSEGGLHGDDRWYGSTYITLAPATVRGGSTPIDLDARELVKLVRADPHLRLRMVRIARREACARALCTLDTLRAEISIEPCSRGISVTIDVECDLVRPHDVERTHAR
jgi:hypothetical protein